MWGPSVHGTHPHLRPGGVLGQAPGLMRPSPPPPPPQGSHIPRSGQQHGHTCIPWLPTSTTPVPSPSRRNLPRRTSRDGKWVPSALWTADTAQGSSKDRPGGRALGLSVCCPTVDGGGGGGGGGGARAGAGRAAPSVRACVRASPTGMCKRSGATSTRWPGTWVMTSGWTLWPGPETSAWPGRSWRTSYLRSWRSCPTALAPWPRPGLTPAAST